MLPFDKIRVCRRDGAFELSLNDTTDTASVMQEAMRVLPVARVELKRPRLEDIFVSLVAGESADEAEVLMSELNKPLAEAAD